MDISACFRVMLFIAGLPVIECIIFCLTIGHDPLNLKFAVLNEELNGAMSCPTFGGNGLDNLGCRFLKQMEERKIELVSPD